MLKNFESTVNFKFGVLHNYAAVGFFFGYSPENFCGYELRIKRQKDGRGLTYKLLRIDEERIPVDVEPCTEKNAAFAESDKEYVLNMSHKERRLICEIRGYNAAEFEIDAQSGLVGVSRPNFIGVVIDTVSDVIYTGFALFEDYPMSCAYQTWRGAFGVGASLVKAPPQSISRAIFKQQRCWSYRCKPC